jgi:quinol monooxygenase YgiN
MELFIFARFHAREGREEALATVLSDQLKFVRTEPGCILIAGFRSARDQRQFYFHSRWIDEAAFDVHAELPNTLQSLDRVQVLIDHLLDVTRARPFG